MKSALSIIWLFYFGSLVWAQESPDLDWDSFETEHIPLELPLLIIKGSQGILACGYIDAETCTKTGEACAIVTGVKTHDDMLEAEVSSLSVAAAEMGVELGMKGLDAIKLMQ